MYILIYLYKISIYQNTDFSISESVDGLQQYLDSLERYCDEVNTQQN